MSRVLVSRVCASCMKDKGTLAYRYQVNGKTERDYFHPRCFRKWVKEI